MPRRRQARLGRGRHAADRPPAAGSGLPGQSPRKPLRLPDRDLRHGRRPGDGRGREAAGTRRTRSGDGAAEDDGAGESPDPLRRLQARLLRRREGALAHAGRLRDAHDDDRPEALDLAGLRSRRDAKRFFPDNAGSGRGELSHHSLRGAQLPQLRSGNRGPGGGRLLALRPAPGKARRLPGNQGHRPRPAAGPDRQAGRAHLLLRCLPGLRRFEERQSRAGKPELPVLFRARHGNRRRRSRPSPLLRPGQGLPGRPLQIRPDQHGDPHPGRRRSLRPRHRRGQGGAAGRSRNGPHPRRQRSDPDDPRRHPARTSEASPCTSTATSSP